MTTREAAVAGPAGHRGVGQSDGTDQGVGSASRGNWNEGGTSDRGRGSGELRPRYPWVHTARTPH